MKSLNILLLASIVSYSTMAQQPAFKEQINRDFSVTKNAVESVLAIYNINGSVRIEGYTGDKVFMEVSKTITAKDEENLQIGKTEFKLETQQHGDSIIANIAAPFDSRPNHQVRNWDEKKKIMYKYNLEFTLKVPYAMRLNISNVNGGEIRIKDITGPIAVSNVNGGINIENARSEAVLQTVNGHVKASFLSVPTALSSFKTINGDITLSCPASLSADCEYKSFKGEFFTDFEDATTLPAAVTRNESKERDKTVYKVRSDRGVRIGGGKNKLKFETFHGNVYVKKQS